MRIQAGSLLLQVLLLVALTKDVRCEAFEEADAESEDRKSFRYEVNNPNYYGDCGGQVNNYDDNNRRLFQMTVDNPTYRGAYGGAINNYQEDFTYDVSNPTFEGAYGGELNNYAYQPPQAPQGRDQGRVVQGGSNDANAYRGYG